MAIQRYTMFKVAPENQEKMIEAYNKLASDNKKDGKQYISGVQAYKLYEDPRSQGFTIAAKTNFESVEDMKYYDEQCEAHNALKGAVKPLVMGPPMMFYMDA